MLLQQNPLCIPLTLCDIYFTIIQTNTLVSVQRHCSTGEKKLPLVDLYLCCRRVLTFRLDATVSGNLSLSKVLRPKVHHIHTDAFFLVKSRLIIESTDVWYSRSHSSEVDIEGKCLLRLQIGSS